MNGTQHLDIAGATDVGKLRSVNEDSLIIDREHALFAVADGMGGHGAGDVASQLAITVLNESTSSCLQKSIPASQDTQEYYYNALLSAITAANDRVFDVNRQNGFQEGAGMGTTLVGLCFIQNSQQAITFNIGDSRLYRHRNGELTQVTRDHTMYREWEENGRLGPAPPKNIILRAIGLFAAIEADLSVINIEDGDTFILCSDGLSGMIEDAVITGILSERTSDPAQAISQHLIDLANTNGGEDNVTVITIKQSAVSAPTVNNSANTVRVNKVVDGSEETVLNKAVGTMDGSK